VAKERNVSYLALEEHCRRLSRLDHLEAIASWDEAAMMPVGGGAARGAALATLRGLIHTEASSPRVGELIEQAKQELDRLGPWQRSNLRELERQYVRATAIPASLVEASSLAESKSEQAWRGLRKDNDWNGYRPLLEEVVGIRREVASALATRLGLSPYDALLAGYEPGTKSEHIAPLFAELGAFLPEFIAQAIERQKSEPCAQPVGPFPRESQRELGLYLMRRLGFDFEHGRLDTSHHPFCGGVPQDVRITTRYDESDFLTSLMGVLHETGHAKYEQHLPPEYLDQPVGKARSMAMHESQSLLLEMQVCRSAEFAEFVAPHLAEAFPDAARGTSSPLSVKNLSRLITRVTPDFIRVDADEVTYPCHIVLRFEIERGLIEGTLGVADIPELWDEYMRRLLGLSTAGNFKDGCMQDVHWPAGLFGYFPTYTLGALTAAQLFEAARAAHPGLGDAIARGDLSLLDGWLTKNVWGKGSLLETGELVTQATGAPLGTAAFQRHLRRRYLGQS
jgi:carboxypeptidase Taq